MPYPLFPGFTHDGGSGLQVASNSHRLGAESTWGSATAAAPGMRGAQCSERCLTHSTADGRTGQSTGGQIATVRAGLRQSELRHRAGLRKGASTLAAIVIGRHRCLAGYVGRHDDIAITSRRWSTASSRALLVSMLEYIERKLSLGFPKRKQCIGRESERVVLRERSGDSTRPDLKNMG
jgi:hypothetical protein